MSLQPVSGATKTAPESNLYLDVIKEGSDLPGLSQFTVAGSDLKQLQNGYNYTATAHPRASSKDDDDKKKDDEKKSDDKKDDDRKSTPSRSASSSKSSEPKTQEKPSAAKSSSEKDDTVRVPVQTKKEFGDEESWRYVEVGGKKYEVKHERNNNGPGYVEVPGDPHAKHAEDKKTQYYDVKERQCSEGDCGEVYIEVPKSEVDSAKEEPKDD